jgi:serine/threonine protein kinase
MSDTYGLTKTLGVIDICTKPNGEKWFAIGNNSIIFRIRYQGRDKMLKCYTRHKQNLRRIYGAKCLREELYIHSDERHGEWVDVVLDDWIDGVTLHQAIVDSLDNPSELQYLAEQFDRLALGLLLEPWAHGDLKPENIMVTPEGELRLIDFDALFSPEFDGEQSDEIGTAAYQHPARNSSYFDKSIDDYPIALISTAMHALALDPSLAARYDTDDMLLMHPKDIVNHNSKALDEIMLLFAERGKAVSYRIARLLDSVTPRLFGLENLLRYATSAVDTTLISVAEMPIIDHLCGLWGFRQGEQWVIPPIYDNGLDFSEDLAAVCVGGKWHYIDRCGQIALCCPQYDAVKSFRNGEAIVIENGVRKIINRTGTIIGLDKSKSYR